MLFEDSCQGYESSNMWVPLLNDAFGKRTLNRVFRIKLSIKRVSIERIKNMYFENTPSGILEF